jgi:phosphoribosylanthranilate isomerase
MPVRVKICGIKDLDTARGVVELGADYLGLVFTESPRQVTLSQAERLVASLPTAQFIAVARDADDDLLEAMLAIGVVGVQLHGRTPAHWIHQVHQRGKLAIATRLEADADVVLLDGANPGSGQPWAWYKPTFHRPIWLAGGLNPDNVGRVVKTWRPDGVDVSSGVEQNGVKNLELVRRFIEEVHHADNASA